MSKCEIDRDYSSADAKYEIIDVKLCETMNRQRIIFDCVAISKAVNCSSADGSMNCE